MKTISEGTISKEDFTKAVALAKYRALEEGQNFEAGLVATGAGLIHGGKPFQIDQVGKAVEGVSIEKLKTVCPFFSPPHCTLTDKPAGCQGSFGRKGDRVGCWRSLCPTFRGRNWSQSIRWWALWIGNGV